MHSEKSDTIGPFFLVNASQRQLTIMHRISPALENGVIDQHLVPLITQHSEISLRALDWLVTNYSKKYNIVCKTKNGTLFNIYHGYKTALSHFRRRNFDPFRRRQRITLTSNGNNYETTVGQCNFVHWAYQYGVLAYAIEHANVIEKDMNMASFANKTERKNQIERGIPHRRRELSKAPSTKCSVYKVESHIKFDTLAYEMEE
tara:strand:+ start:2669 stop:3277 length:609 start_codon:yes stop_codon:yes gene_type:complete